MLGHPREHQKSKNECRAAWERFPKMENERRAAWERVFGRDGPDWSPQKGPQKTSKTVYFKLFLTFIGAPLKHPSCAHQKMEQLKWAPKIAHTECSKCSFCRTKCEDLFLLPPLLAPLFCDPLSKYANSHGFYTCFWCPHWVHAGPSNGTPKSKNERHAAWERSRAKRNERHAAWECFSCFHGPVGCLKAGY